MPTTVTRSIGSGGGRDYATIQAWINAAPANLVTADEVWIGECYNDSEFFPGGRVADFGGKTVDATRYFHLRAATGQGFRSDSGAATLPLRYDQSKGVALRVTGNYNSLITGSSVFNRLENLQLYYDSTYSSAYYKSIENISLYGCLFESRRTASIDIANGSSANSKIVNCIIVQRGSSHSGTVIETGGEVIATTVVRPSDLGSGGTGIDQNGTYPLVRNCAVFGFATPFGSTIGSYQAGSSNNASDASSGSIPGSSNQAALTFASQCENVSDATRDWRVKSGGALIANGVRDQTYTNDLDIIGAARSTTTPTIGARESVDTGIPGASSGPGLVIGDEAGFVGEGAIGAPNVGGPATYDVSLAEAAAAADTLSSLATFARTVTEAAAVADALTGLGVFPRALSESVTPTDAMTGGLALASSLAESLTPVDTPAAALVRSGAMAETLSMVDALTSALQGVAALAEAVAAADAPTAARVISPSLTEAVSATDSLAGGLALLSTLTESVAAADAYTAVQVAVAALAETLAANVAIDADQAGVISVSMSESLAVSEAVSSALNALNTLTESLTLTTAEVAARITGAGLAESVSLADVHTAARNIAAALVETAAAVDSLSSIGVFSVQITEAAALIDAPQAAALLSAALSEAIAPTDIIAAIAASYPGDPRRTFTIPGGRGLVVQAGDRVVVVTRKDRTIH